MTVTHAIFLYERRADVLKKELQKAQVVSAKKRNPWNGVFLPNRVPVVARGYPYRSEGSREEVDL